MDETFTPSMVLCTSTARAAQRREPNMSSYTVQLFVRCHLRRLTELSSGACTLTTKREAASYSPPLLDDEEPAVFALTGSVSRALRSWLVDWLVGKAVTNLSLKGASGAADRSITTELLLPACAACTSLHAFLCCFQSCRFGSDKEGLERTRGAGGRHGNRLQQECLISL